MTNESLHATTGGYSLSERPSNEFPQPIDPPEGGGGGLPGDPVKSDYVYRPIPADPPSEPDDPEA